MRRTTVQLDEELLRSAKELAARTGRTLTAVIEDALRQALAQRDERKRRPPVELPTFCGDGIRPGVDLDDSAALSELMENESDPR